MPNIETAGRPAAAVAQCIQDPRAVEEGEGSGLLHRIGMPPELLWGFVGLLFFRLYQIPSG